MEQSMRRAMLTVWKTKIQCGDAATTFYVLPYGYSETNIAGRNRRWDRNVPWQTAGGASWAFCDHGSRIVAVPLLSRHQSEMPLEIRRRTTVRNRQFSRQLRAASKVQSG